MTITVFYLILHVNLKDVMLIRKYLSQINWGEMKGLNTEDLWTFFIGKKSTL